MRSLLIFICLFSFGCAHAKYPTSDHYDGSRFYNEDRTVEVQKGWTLLLRWMLTKDRKEWPEFVNDNAGPDFVAAPTEKRNAVTFINHASTFIQFTDLNVITDPVFAERVSPLSWTGPKRHRSPGARLQELPKISVVIISHNHYDHLDIQALKDINAKDHPLFIVPLGNKELLNDSGIENVVELDWWQSYDFKNRLNISLVPMQHWSARGVFDRSEALWGGYVLQYGQQKVLFAGDTSYNMQFKEIEKKFGPMDLSLLPIGAYEPRWFMKNQHMNPEEAIQAHIDLQSRKSVGIHFGTFQLTDEGIDDPIKDLKLGLEAAKILPETFVAPKNGQTILF